MISVLPAARLVGALTGAALIVAGAPAGAARPDPEPEDEEEQAAEVAGPEAEGPSTEEDESVLDRYHPAPVDGPSLRVPRSPSRLYLDGAYGESKDLGALPYIEGSAVNYRFAVGGAWRWRDFTFEGELPFANWTTLTTTLLPGGPPAAGDSPQSRYSLGDLRVGASFARPLVGTETLLLGVGLRTRIPTHTTKFLFEMQDTMALIEYGFPYYFHVEPAVLLGGALGRFTFVMNQGALIFAGPNGYVLDMYIDVPTLAFWDAHYAVGVSPFRFLGLSVELETALQLNDVRNPAFPGLTDIFAAWVAPGLQLHFGQLRIDVIGRFGLNRGQELLGVLHYVGTNSFTLRAGWRF